MTQEIIEMAQECGLIGMRPHLDGIYSEALEAFAKLVAEAEREACAKIADSQLFNTNALLTAPMQSSAAYQIGVSIRARGQA